MRVLISGSTGFIGSALVDHMRRKGYQVLRLVRQKQPYDDEQVFWDIRRQKLNPADLEGIHAIIHLAGENIAAKHWTPEQKQKIMDSRVQGTRLISETLTRMQNPPQTFICASAVGYYGNRGEEVVTEVSGPGTGFLAQVCREWEAATHIIPPEKDVRIVNTRFGLVLSPEGGILRSVYWPFKLGLAGNLGSGKQYMSWISLSDHLAALEHLLHQPHLRGPINVVAPNPVTNAEFTDAMRKALIPRWLPMHYWTPPAPAWAIKSVKGEMGQELLLSSCRAIPIRLQESGFTFKHPTIQAALSSLF